MLLLPVRSFSGRLRRIGGNVVVDGRGESQQGQDLRLQGRERGEMALGLLRRDQHRQGDLPEGFQQPLRGGLGRHPLGIAPIESRERALLLGQALPHRILDQGEDPQGEGEQAELRPGLGFAKKVRFQRG